MSPDERGDLFNRLRDERKHGRNALEELLLGSSTTNMVIAEGSSDVLLSTRADTS